MRRKLRVHCENGKSKKKKKKKNWGEEKNARTKNLNSVIFQ